MIDKAILDETRAKLFSSPDAYPQLHVGYFITWFSHAELRLTVLIAIVSKIRDPAAFDLLVRGMDIRVKIERFNTLCKLKKVEIGPNLRDRLDYLDKKIRPIRNNLTHSAHSYSERGVPRLFLSSLIRAPLELLEKMEKLPDQIPSDEITLDDLFAYGLWLARFSNDLGEVFDRLAVGQSLEIANPRSWAPKAKDHAQPRKEHSAKKRKPGRKSEEKPK